VTLPNLSHRCQGCGKPLPLYKDHRCRVNTYALKPWWELMLIPRVFPPSPDTGCIVVAPRCSGCPHLECILPDVAFMPPWQGVEARDEYIESHPRYRRFIGTVLPGVEG